MCLAPLCKRGFFMCYHSLMPDPEPLINEDADRALGRILIRYGLWTLLALTLATVVMVPVNAPFGLYWRAGMWRDVFRIAVWDMASIFVVLLPFFRGTGRVFAERLRIGRVLVSERRWREAAAALEPFAAPGQRFLDTTGEAHALLAQSYAGSGEKAKAESVRLWLSRHRPKWNGSVQENAPPTLNKGARRGARPRRRF